MKNKHIGMAVAVALSAVIMAPGAQAAKNYGPGVTDTEIKIGNTTPYSGPLSSVSTTAKTELGYFAMVNSQGGINGRKIRFLSQDDAYSPPKALEQTRKLVESDQVLAIVATPGTPPNVATHKYLNDRGVPQLLIGSGSLIFDDLKHFPWSAPFTPSIDMEGRVYASYVAKAKPDAKVAVLYQDDDFGRGMLNGFKSQLGVKSKSMIVGEASYNVTDPTVDSQIIAMQGAGADTFVFMGTAKAAAQAIRKEYDLGWKPLRLTSWAASSVSGVLQPAGLDKSIGLISATVFLSPTDPGLKNDKDVQDYFAFLKKWYPAADPADVFVVQGYIQAQLTVMILKNCGDELTRANLMKQALSLKNVHVAMMMPRITINIEPGSSQMFHQMQLVRFDGKAWVRHGDVITVNTTN